MVSTSSLILRNVNAHGSMQLLTFLLAERTKMIRRPLNVVQLRLKAVGGGDILRRDSLQLIFFHLSYTQIAPTQG